MLECMGTLTRPIPPGPDLICTAKSQKTPHHEVFEFDWAQIFTPSPWQSSHKFLLYMYRHPQPLNIKFGLIKFYIAQKSQSLRIGFHTSSSSSLESCCHCWRRCVHHVVPQSSPLASSIPLLHHGYPLSTTFIPGNIFSILGSSRILSTHNTSLFLFSFKLFLFHYYRVSVDLFLVTFLQDPSVILSIPLVCLKSI